MSSFDINLNPIEEIIYAHESKNFSFNCGLVLNFDIILDDEKLKNSILSLIDHFPILNTRIQREKKLNRVLLDSFSIKEVFNVLNFSDDYCEDFTNKFDLENLPAFKFILIKNKESSTLKFYIHHTLVDGISQAHMIKELMHIYLHNKPSKSIYSRPSLNKHKLNKWQVFKLLFNSRFRSHYKDISKNYDCLNIGLLGPPSPQAYKSINIDIAGDHFSQLKLKCKKAKSTTFTFILNCLGLSLIKTAPMIKKNIVFAIPINLRPVFKLSSYIGNLVVLTRLEIPYKSFIDNSSVSVLSRSLRSTVSKNFLTQSSQLIFGLRSIFSLKKLEIMFSKKTTSPRQYNSSMMVSYLKVGNNTFPKELKVTSISLLSAIFKSPGLGAVISEFDNKMQVTITYCESEFSEDIINKFISNFTILTAKNN